MTEKTSTEQVAYTSHDEVHNIATAKCTLTKPVKNNATARYGGTIWLSDVHILLTPITG